MNRSAVKPTGARSMRPRSVTPKVEQNEAQDKTRFVQSTEYIDQLVIDNMKLAQKRANIMSLRTKMPFDDLYQVALIGLLKGCKKYDPTKINSKNDEPYKLSTIAVPFIDGAMQQYLRDRGHSSGVKFPDRWRDKASLVRKRASEGIPVEQIATITGLRIDEINEILIAQSAPVALDPEIKLYANTYDDDIYDDCYELQQALVIADRAHEAISSVDQNLLEAAWNHERRRYIAVGPFFQFMQRARRIADGLPIIVEEQIDLSLEITVQEKSEINPDHDVLIKKKISDPKEIMDIAMSQLDLF